ncbi:MAG: hypothetical protein K2L89_01965 [Muribaculaceae bacterium]|nr:hypothetical protein [Muribaculaceae bacterium]
MTTSFSKSRYALMRLSAPLFSLFLTFIILLSSCGKGSSSDNGKDSLQDSVAKVNAAETFHADNDIAMTLKSVIDALNQGEELDSIDYNYEGILTDGTGHPLYTDIQGTPGVWAISVENPETLVIKNIYLGDLLPDALKSYILQSLGLETDNIMEQSKFKNVDSSDSNVYHINGAYLIFKTDTAMTPAGQEGPLMSIVATSIEPLKP